MADAPQDKLITTTKGVPNREPSARSPHSFHLHITRTEWTALKRLAEDAGYCEVTPFMRFVIRRLIKERKVYIPE